MGLQPLNNPAEWQLGVSGVRCIFFGDARRTISSTMSKSEPKKTSSSPDVKPALPDVDPVVDAVEEASEESFPASDPPAWVAEPTRPANPSKKPL
jgi:hypothetical protein